MKIKIFISLKIINFFILIIEIIEKPERDQNSIRFLHNWKNQEISIIKKEKITFVLFVFFFQNKLNLLNRFKFFF